MLDPDSCFRLAEYQVSDPVIRAKRIEAPIELKRLDTWKRASWRVPENDNHEKRRG